MVTYFRGRNVATMTREELIDTVIELGRAFESATKAHEATLRVWNTCRKVGAA